MRLTPAHRMMKATPHQTMMRTAGRPVRFRMNRILPIVGAALLMSSCGVNANSPNMRVQSEMIYFRDQAPMQTCWVTAPGTGRFSLNRYWFYFYEQNNEEACAEGLPVDRPHYAFNRQFQPELAIRIVEYLHNWQAGNPDTSFLADISECGDGPRSLDIALISFPAITRASEIYVDFWIRCPDLIDGVRARVGFSYDHEASRIVAEERSIIWS